jgi:predicted ferric reductase
MATPLRPNSGLRSRPFHWPLNRTALELAFLANAGLIVYLWLRHGSGDSATSSPAAFCIAAGELAALLGTYLALVGLLLVARTPFIEQVFGEDALRLHRFTGFGTVLLLGGHIAFSVGGFALSDGISFTDELGSMVLTYPFMLAGAAAFGLFAMIGFTNLPVVRKRLSYETWTGLHLYAYLATVLGLGHQLVGGTDFAAHPLARAYWVGLFIVTFGLIAVFRFVAPVVLLVRHRFRIEQVVIESSDVVSIYVTGRNLDRLPVRAGQYFRFRLLVRNEWWRSHPFSLSAEPDGRTLRFTVKAIGDFSARLQTQDRGARVMLEGPCGSLTTAVRRRHRVALIGGGIGVTPLRALFEELAGKSDVKLIYRASSPQDTVFSEEFEELTRQPGADVTYLVGRRGNPNMPENPLSPAMILSIVPDIETRDVFLCGPNAMMDTVIESLDLLGVPRDRIHSERFAA